MRLEALAVLAIIALTDSVSAQETLAWKFKPGESFYLERVYHQTQMIDVKNKNFKQESASTWVSKFTVKEAGPDGAVLEQTIVSVVHKKTGKDAPAEAQFTQKMKGATLVVALSPAGRVQKLTGYEELVKKVAEKDDEQEKALRFLVPESSLRDGLEEVFGFLPEKPAKVSDRWQREATEAVAPFGSFRTRFLYTLLAAAKDEAKIAYTLEMTYVPPEKETPLFRIIKGDLRADDGKGTASFDAAKGRALRGDKQVTVRGNLVLESGGNQSNLQFVSENRMKWRVFDEPPK